MNKKKIVLITGASSGIGKETALFLAQRGFIVYAGSREPKRLMDIEDTNIIPLKLDITDGSNIETAIKTIKKEHKTIDILINNAGYGLFSTVEDVSEEQMYEQFNINVFGLLRVCKAVIPLMRQNESGVIINISSFLGKIGLPLLTLYNSSKYAVEGITDSLRYELRDFNIRVHSIMPGFFNTNFSKENLKINDETFAPNSPYVSMVSNLTSAIKEQVDKGNDPKEVAELILEIIENEKFQARITAGEKAQKFIPMKKELSDEDFERRVREYYGL